jgi:hypothetical protein
MRTQARLAAAGDEEQAGVAVGRIERRADGHALA